MNYKNCSDEALVMMAQGGDAEAEECLIRKYKDVVRGKAHLYFIVGADSEDIVQEGMIGIFKAIRSYKDSREASFRTFAEICINRQILTAIKAAGRQKHIPLNTSLSIDSPVSGSDADQEKTLGDTLSLGKAGDPESLLILKEEMDCLEGKGADIFSDMELQVWNEYLKGRTYTQIAESIGKTPKTVDNAIQRTKRKLEAYLEISR